MTEYRPRPGEVDAILRRGARVRAWHAAAAGAACAVLAAFALVPNVARTSAGVTPAGSPTARPRATAPTTTRPRTAPTPAPGATASVRPLPPSAPATGAPATTGPVAAPPPPASPGCAEGRNAGATDRGVTRTSVDVFSTFVGSGLSSGTYGERRHMLGVLVEAANRAGGICGRQVRARLADDGGERLRGSELLRKAIEEGAFAIPYVGMPHVLEEFAATGEHERTATPIVGFADGTPSLYAADWIWPVGVSDASAARIMVREAHRRGARSFGVVFDESATGQAFDAEVLQLTGRHVDGYGQTGCARRYCGPGQRSPAEFYADPPDFVGLLTNPADALAWMQSTSTPGAGDPRVPHGYGAVDPLREISFRTNCKAKCDGLRVWSAFKAPCGAYRQDPAFERFERDAEARRAYPYSTTIGAYAGVQMFLDALRQAGSELTRERLRRVLGTATLRADLTVAETFSFADGPGNTTMRAYDVAYRGAPAECTLGPVGRL